MEMEAFKSTLMGLLVRVAQGIVPRLFLPLIHMSASLNFSASVEE